MAINSAAVNAVIAHATANPQLVRRPSYLKLTGQTLTTNEDLPEVRRQLLGIRHVRPVNLTQGWAA